MTDQHPHESDDVLRVLHESAEQVYCASEKAIVAAAAGYHSAASEPCDPKGMAQALVMLHTESLGLDRSVCLRDVYEFLELAYHPQAGENTAHPADVLYDRFGRGADDDAPPLS